MTTTPTASPELPDLDRLEALARAASGWRLDTVQENQLGAAGDDGEFNDILTVDADQYGDVDEDHNSVVLSYLAAANPAAVLALIAAARRAQPEGEAPQAELRALHDELNRITWEGEDEGWNLAIAAVQKRIRELLGTPATSAEEPYSAKLAKRGAPVAEVRAAERVEAMHAGVVGVFAAIKDQHAAAQHAESGKEIVSAYQRGYMDGIAKGRRDVAEDVKDSAPGTPEAPADIVLDAQRWRALLGSARIRILGSAGIKSDVDPNGNPHNGYAHFGMEIWTMYGSSLSSEQREQMRANNESARELLIKYADIARAAQLDGGQGEGK